MKKKSKLQNFFKMIIENKKFEEILKDLKIQNAPEYIKNILEILEKEEICDKNNKNRLEKSIQKEFDLTLKNEAENKKILKNEINIFSDGAVSGNPGIAGIGCVIFEGLEKEISRENKFLGVTTNNIAEYKAILLALDNIAELKKEGFIKNIETLKFNFFSDSELMIRQLNGQYKISNLKLQKLAMEFKQKINKLGIKNYTLKHIYREHNKIADELAVLAKNKKIIKSRAK
ncbi:MAG: ribonuclease HI family protein [Elusimicrobiota bacterium]|nr:ribonuclease HI family protein [Elusimicrobiota bacterium]